MNRAQRRELDEVDIGVKTDHGWIVSIYGNVLHLAETAGGAGVRSAVLANRALVDVREDEPCVYWWKR